MTERNSDQTTVTRTQSRGETSSGLEGVRQKAKAEKRLRFTQLMHHMTPELLRESYDALSKDAAPGVDGVTWAEYGVQLIPRLEALHASVHGGTYRAKPSKRIWIPKADGRQRPIGIASIEDKIVQHAASTILGAIYEEDFAGFSYGFRPNRHQHMALDAVQVGIVQRKIGWVIDADIRGFFDNLDHGWLMKFVEHRVADPRMLRLIRKWIRAGVSEDGEWSRTSVGTPQGAVISPLLANIYLHHVLDQWVEWWRKNPERGEVIFVRYADDFIAGFQYKSDAEEFLREMKERLAKFGLELHPEKTRLIEFGRYAADNRKRRGEGKPETFDFLGFTHRCGKTKTNGRFTVLRRTIARKMKAKLQEIRQSLKRMRHAPIPDQGEWLGAVVGGYLNYHSVPENWKRMAVFRGQVCKAWMAALRRRSQKGDRLTWEKLKPHIEKWIPPNYARHLYPYQRLIVSYSR